ncbi:MAG: biopolymer transporter ExbD [Planctomycetota bacterium]
MSSRRPSDEVTINLTPMIDVVFLLVIFFMVGSKFSEAESKVNVNVASASEMKAITRLPDRRTVDIELDGSVRLNGQPVDLPQLFDRLKTEIDNYPGLSVLVRAERSGNFQRVDEVFRSVRNAGVDDILVEAKGDALLISNAQGAGAEGFSTQRSNNTQGPYR